MSESKSIHNKFFSNYNSTAKSRILQIEELLSELGLQFNGQRIHLKHQFSPLNWKLLLASCAGIYMMGFMFNSTLGLYASIALLAISFRGPICLYRAQRLTSPWWPWLLERQQELICLRSELYGRYSTFDFYPELIDEEAAVLVAELKGDLREKFYRLELACPDYSYFSREGQVNFLSHTQAPEAKVELLYCRKSQESTLTLYVLQGGHDDPILGEYWYEKSLEVVVQSKRFKLLKKAIQKASKKKSTDLNNEQAA